METLYAMSIRQPWLDMIVRGVKTLELRNWTDVMRGRIALHAARKIDDAAACFYGYEKPWLLPRGKVVALAEIVDIFEIDEKSWIEQIERHRQVLPYTGRETYAFQLAHVQTLTHPIALRGRLKFFPLPPDVASRVDAETKWSAVNPLLRMR
jgi:hypothetical protein